MIAVISALVLAFMLQDETGDFMEWLGIWEDDSSCEVSQEQYQSGMIDEEEFNERTSDPEKDCPLPETTASG